MERRGGQPEIEEGERQQQQPWEEELVQSGLCVLCVSLCAPVRARKPGEATQQWDVDACICVCGSEGEEKDWMEKEGGAWTGSSSSSWHTPQGFLKAGGRGQEGRDGEESGTHSWSTTGQQQQQGRPWAAMMGMRWAASPLPGPSAGHHQHADSGGGGDGQHVLCLVLELDSSIVVQPRVVMGGEACVLPGSTGHQ